MRFVFPHAPLLTITANKGYEMPAWYDIYSFELYSKQDEMEIARGIASERIVLVGFSQGGTIALHTALRFKQKLAGVMVLSSYLPIADFIAEEMHNYRFLLRMVLTTPFYH